MEHLEEIQEMAESEDIWHMKKLIKEHFTPKLFEIIHEIQSSKSIAEQKYMEVEKDYD